MEISEKLGIREQHSDRYKKAALCILQKAALAATLRFELRHRDDPITRSLANCCLTD